MRKAVLLISALALWSASVQAADNEWAFETFIRVPYSNTLFLGRDAENNVYATTFNSTGKPAEVVAFKISNALSANPQVTAFDRFLAPAQRGYAGITVDQQGNIYLSADQGDGAPSFIKKYSPSLELDHSFGTNGVLASSKVRLLGLTSYRNYIVCAVAWARFLVIDSHGTFLGMTPELPREQQAMIRDIDIIPQTQEIVGVDRDSVYVFTGGTLQHLNQYALRALARGSTNPASGEAIYYSSITDRIYYTSNQGHRLASITRGGRAVQTVENSGAIQGVSQPADAVISSDGSTMFVSDLGAPNIVRFRHGGVHVAIGAPRTAGSKVIAAAETASAPEAKGTARPVVEVSPGPKSSAIDAKPASRPPEEIAAAQTPSIPPAPNLTLPTPAPIADTTSGTSLGPLPTPMLASVSAFNPSATSETPAPLAPLSTPIGENTAPVGPGLSPAPGLPTPALPLPTAVQPALPSPAASSTPLGSTPTAPPPLSTLTPAVAAPSTTPTPAPALPTASPTSGSTAAVTTPSSPTATVPGSWASSLEQAFQQASIANKRVAAFFYSPESSVAQEIDKNVFGDPTFFSQFPDMVYVRIDVPKQPELMGKYGFFKVPVLIIFSPSQKELKRIDGNFTKQDFAAAYAATKLQ